MDFKIIAPILISCLPTYVFANFDEPKPTLSLGASSMALVQSVKYKDSSNTTNTFAGLQLIAAGNLTDNFQLQTSLYRLQYTDNSELTVYGNNFKANFGTGFMSKGFRSYLSVGIFSESFDNGTKSERINGLEVGAAMGYSFNKVSIDYGFSVRDSSDYQQDSLYANADVISATGFLNFSGEF